MMITQEQSKQHSSISPSEFQEIRETANGIGFTAEDCNNLDSLQSMGFGFDQSRLSDMASMLGAGPSYAQDNFPAGLTTSNAGSPVQFAQTWLPGFVNFMTAPRKIDMLVGMATVGRWEDEQIVWGEIENNNNARVYGDTANPAQGNWNVNYNVRTVVRFETSVEVLKLESARASLQRINSAEEKRYACSRELEIIRNRIGFNGYNNGTNLTYGFFNDPNLPNYVTVSNGASGSTEWSSKTFLEIIADIRYAAQNLQTKSKGIVDPFDDDIILALPNNAVNYLSVVSDFGISVRDWITKTYPKWNIISVPELDNANGTVGGFYLYAVTVQDDKSSDDNRTFVQVVPQKFLLLGVNQNIKGYEEGYSNATAGTLLKRTFAVCRFSGIST